MKGNKICKTKYQIASVCSIEVLYTPWRISDISIPDGVHKYEIRKEENGFALDDRVLKNFNGTILSNKKLEKGSYTGTFFNLYPDREMTVNEYLAP